MGAGLLVALAALILSRNATKFFQSESRIATAQLGATLGMSRLSADLMRAGYLASPNATRDPNVCDNRSQWPIGLSRLSAVTIVQQGSVAAHGAALSQSTANNLYPDSIVIGGSFDTTEQFPIRRVVPGTNQVELQIASGAFVRAVAAGTAGGAQLTDIFRAGRYLRLQGPLGQEIYGVIQSITVVGTPPVSATINLANIPPLLFSNGPCSINGYGTGWLVNPVSRVRYDLRSLAGDATFGPLVAQQGAPMSGDDKRTELVRVELDATDNEIASTLEIVSEFAVDLKFGLRTVTGLSGGTNPALGQLFGIQAGLGNAQVYTIAADVFANVTATPQLIRAVQVRLSTRARAPDRDSDLGAAADGHRPRMLINTASVKPVYARVRTLYAETVLQNVTGETW